MSTLRSRLARNIYFWLGVALFLAGLNTQAHEYDRSVYNWYKVATTCLLMAMTYINNLWLAPKLLRRKKIFLFILSAFVLVLVSATAFVLLMKQMLTTYPGIEIYHVSFITSPVSTEWSLSAVLSEVPDYAFGLGMWLVVFTMAWYTNQYYRQEKLVQQAAQKQMETEMHFLRTQLNPHFLFNTLNNIYGLSLRKEDAASESILKLSSILRYLLYDSNTKLMPFEQEKEAMRSYIDMELLRLQDMEDFSFDIEADADYKIPPLLWLPVLENAFKHGTRFIAQDYFIKYRFMIKNGVLTIHASNNYKEAASNNVQNGGLGLENLRKRLNILYPGKHNITVQKKNGIYSIDVKINL